jgi:DNA-binding NarL/FixJ family response regulator
MSKLTPREKQVVAAIQQKPGLTVKGIGNQIGISQHAAKFHLQNVYGKLQVRNRPELVANLCQGRR